MEEIMKLSQLAETLIGSEIVKLGNEINERIRQGETIYNYTIGDFNSEHFPIPKQLEDLIIKAYQEGKTNYPPADGILALRQAVSQYIQHYLNLQFNANEILIASGGRPLIYAAFRSIVDKEDTVIYATPSWNNNHYTHFTEGKHVVIEALPENKFMPTAEQIAPYIKEAVLLAINTPLNPTGTTMSQAELAKICQLVVDENNRRTAEQKKLYILFDQMYWPLCFNNIKHITPLHTHPELKPYTIFIDGISKVFSATGVRVGWSLAPALIVNKMKAILSHVGAWAPMAEQHAVAQYLTQFEVIDNYVNTFIQNIQQRLQLFYNGIETMRLKQIPVKAIQPEGAMYLSLSISAINATTPDGEVLSTQKSVTDYVLNKAKLAIVPFTSFGSTPLSSWYRLSVGTCSLQEIPVVLASLETALSELKYA
jgi:aspartate aminotransferase